MKTLKKEAKLMKKIRPRAVKKLDPFVCNGVLRVGVDWTGPH